MIAGTNLTALMKGMSSLTAHLDIETVLAQVYSEAQTASHVPMHLPNTHRQSQQDRSQIAESQRLNQAGHNFPPNLPLSPNTLMLIFCLRLALRL